MRITAFDEAKKKDVFIGMYDAKTKIFTKPIGKEHYMTKEKGYGIQEEAVAKLYNLGCEKIHLVLETQTLEYPFPLIDLKPAKDYGHGSQKFVTVREANVIKKPLAQPSWLRKG